LIVTVPPVSFQMPPPTWVAELPESVLLPIVTVPPLLMPLS
jgi:hypothetical protein